MEIVNTTIGRVCDFEEHECGFVSAGDTDFVSWVRTSRMLMPGGDMQLLELTPSQDSTYHTVAGASLLDFMHNLRTIFVEEHNAVITLFVSIISFKFGPIAFLLSISFKMTIFITLF